MTTLSARNPERSDGSNGAYLGLEGYGVTFYPSGLVLAPNGKLIVNFISGPGTGTVTYLVLFDFYVTADSYPTSVSITGISPATTCTAADLRASNTGNVVTCAATISGSFEELFIQATQSGAGAFNLGLVDVSVMRVR